MLKRLFKTKKTNVSLSRRRFIKTSAHLAFLTVAAGVMPSLLTIKSIESQIASGLVEGETFYLYEPIVINMPGVEIRNCKFIAKAPMPYMIKIEEGSAGSITSCIFDGNGMVGV